MLRKVPRPWTGCPSLVTVASPCCQAKVRQDQGPCPASPNRAPARCR
ncbi:Atypical ORF [Ralstonia solanacearum UW551]|uniref:Atypical ORF n=1 Tax=Ralstonia solanacearum (strain UW551) TaxID=342110 RepID=A0AB33VBW3_RALSU|nr:Atypical ORF [Ralstonia solanacearum UW551]